MVWTRPRRRNHQTSAVWPIPKTDQPPTGSFDRVAFRRVQPGPPPPQPQTPRFPAPPPAAPPNANRVPPNPRGDETARQVVSALVVVVCLAGVLLGQLLAASITPDPMGVTPGPWLGHLVSIIFALPLILAAAIGFPAWKRGWDRRGS